MRGAELRLLRILVGQFFADGIEELHVRLAGVFAECGDERLVVSPAMTSLRIRSRSGEGEVLIIYSHNS